MNDKSKEQPGQQGFSSVDPLRDTYRRSITHVPAVKQSLEHHNTALLCIDIQYLDAARGHGIFASTETTNVPAEAQNYYFDRLEQYVLPNVERFHRETR